MEFLSQIDLNYIFATLIVFASLAYKIWLSPYLKNKGIDTKYYNLIEQALLLGATMFRSDKVIKIITIAYNIVISLETLNATNDTKQQEGVKLLAEKLLNDLKIVLPEETLNLIIHLAVALMGEKTE
jgi:hypothetical protein